MENTLENKMKFFAQYWGQDNLCDVSHGFKSENENCNWHQLFQNNYLELIPLSLITDEDYRYVVKNERMNPNHSLDDVELEGRISGIKESDILCADYFRSKGYALPWLGLSVEKQIEYGWIKLKSE